jgi:CRISPR-associated protein (TIGR02710 family)
MGAGGDRMKRALFMTVGTGVGNEEERIHSLAHGLLESIEHYNPTTIVFFGSKLSEKTVESLKEQYHEHFGDDLDNYDFILINDVDQFDECFKKLRTQIYKYSDYEVIVDYTSGTKTMTMSAAIASVLYHKKLTVISGKRGQNGLVIRGTENISPQALYAYYDEISLEKVNDFFNNYRFDAAKETLDQIVEVENREAYEKIIDAYRKWDMFDHPGAMELLKNEKNKNLKIKGSLKDNKTFIGNLIHLEREKELYIIADLLNNSQRRAVDHKYDDALARLYRTVELIAQCKLKEKGIDSSNVDLEKIPLFARKEYAVKQDENGRIRIGLHSSYKLLQYLDQDLGKNFVSDNRLKDLLKKRNDSILAHGLTPIAQENYTELYEKTFTLARELTPQIDDLMKKAEFPRL